ncbi:MAG: L-serine ammonia-lyase, iron-sulfur-dependent subunit beta [bacterium]
MENTSLFDIIGPVMIGPSSSHTAGAVRLGLLARNIYGSQPSKVQIVLYNSFSKTQKGHGTDKGLIGGILGFDVDNPNIKNSLAIAQEKNISIDIFWEENSARHPNSVDIIFDNLIAVSGDSTGAGEVQIIQINDFKVSIIGNLPCLVMVYKDKPGMISAVSKLIQDENINIATFECTRTGKGEDASMVIALDAKLPDAVVKEIEQIPDVYLVRSLEGLKK